MEVGGDHLAVRGAVFQPVGGSDADEEDVCNGEACGKALEMLQRMMPSSNIGELVAGREEPVTDAEIPPGPENEFSNKNAY